MSAIIALSVGAKIISGCLLDVTNFSVIQELPKTVHENRLLESISTYVGNAKSVCLEKQYKLVHVAIASKGEVLEDGSLKLSRYLPPFCITQSIEKEFSLHTTVVNRFHSYALGACHESGCKKASIAVINVSDGVGYGIIQNGKLVTHYDKQKGCGGLDIVERMSDRQKMPIAHISGLNYVLDRIAQKLPVDSSLADLFRFGVWYENDKISQNAYTIISDIIYSLIHVIADIKKIYSVSNVMISIYPNCYIGDKDREEFTVLLRKKLQRNDDARVLINYFQPKVSEERTKQIGAAIHSESQKNGHLTDPVNKKLFSITGEPTAGKSTFANRLLETFLEKNIKIAACISKEVRDKNHRRIGFTIETIDRKLTHTIYELATISEKQSIDEYRNFKNTLYRINLTSVKKVSAFLSECVKDVDIILIDEVASMQLYVDEFCKVIDDILKTDKIVIATVPTSSRHPLIGKIKQTSNQIKLDILNKSESQENAFNKIVPSIEELLKRD